jgi:hypothetical protein
MVDTARHTRYAMGTDSLAHNVKQAVEGSGYPFELGIARRVEAYDYLVTPNTSFEDQDTGQAREIDFHAIRAEPIATRRHEFVFPVLLGSCKANRNPYVFFTRDDPLSGIALHVDPPISGRPSEILVRGGEREDASDFFNLHQFLHIATTPRISSQFCELCLKKGKWQVSQEAVFNSVLVPLIKALAREIETHDEQARPEICDTDSNYQIYYPVLVTKGPLYEYYVPREGSPEVRETRHLVLVRHYQSRVLSGEFAIDVIHECFLEEYLRLINSEVHRLVMRIRRHRQYVTKSVKALAQEAREAQTPHLV